MPRRDKHTRGQPIPPNRHHQHSSSSAPSQARRIPVSRVTRPPMLQREGTGGPRAGIKRAEITFLRDPANAVRRSHAPAPSRTCTSLAFSTLQSQRHRHSLDAVHFSIEIPLRPGKTRQGVAVSTGSIDLTRRLQSESGWTLPPPHRNPSREGRLLDASPIKFVIDSRGTCAALSRPHSESELGRAHHAKHPCFAADGA